MERKPKTRAVVVKLPLRGAKKFFMVTRYLGEHLDLKKVQEHVKKYQYLNHDHPLVMQFAPDSYAVLTKFGTVSFWNVREESEKTFIEEIRPYAGNVRSRYDYKDTLKVYTGVKKEKITFEELYLRDLDLEKIKIISYVSAQSVALDRYEEEIDERLSELGKVAENIKDAGHTRFSQSQLLKQIGNVLSVKQHAVSSLSLFDKPNETWEREEIENLYIRLRSEYELRDRFDILNEKIDFLSENNITLLNFISSQKANYLELIIIILIVVEIILFLMELLKVF